jgi:hypothetical protein
VDLLIEEIEDKLAQKHFQHIMQELITEQLVNLEGGKEARRV